MTAAQLDQKRAALAFANEVRMRNADLKRELAGLPYVAGCERVAAVLASPVGPVASIPISQLLLAIHRVGDDGLIRFLRYAGIFNSMKRVGALTARQRQMLIWALRDRTILWPASQEARAA